MRVVILLSILLISAFNPVLAEPDFAHIKHMAQLSSDTYEAAQQEELNTTALANKLAQQDEVLLHDSVIPNSDVLYFLSENSQYQTIAIRGTANLNNVIVDLTVSLQPNTVLGILLHQGFAEAAQQVLEDVRPYLRSNKPIRITGHSLGGAIAVVLGMLVQEESLPLEQITTFGQPKVTNVSGAKKFADLPLTRVVTQDDIVPLVPPISPLQIRNLDIFWHMGEEIILLAPHQYSITSGLKSAMRATKFTNKLPSEANLLAHTMAQYLSLLEQLQQDKQGIPYRMDINLFGISID